MQFEFKGHTGSSHSDNGVDYDNFSWYDGSPLLHIRRLMPIIRPPDFNDPVEKRRLDLTWFHWPLYHGKAVFDFRSFSEYYIYEEESPPSLESVIKVVNHSHRNLRELFEGRRVEYPLLGPIAELSEDTSKQFAEQMLMYFQQQQQN